MRIGGLQRLTLIDFPGKVAATVFTQGCNFRCGFCHNAELVCPELFKAPLSEQDFFDFLAKRQDKLQGVVVSGGEPTLQKDLVDFVAKIKAMGFAAKLDTNGSRPDVITSLLDLRLIDFIAMDVKTSLARYSDAVGVDCNQGDIKRSIEIIMASGLPHQFRTTVVADICSTHDLEDIQGLIKGSANYVLQPFIPSSCMVAIT